LAQQLAGREAGTQQSRRRRGVLGGPRRGATARMRGRFKGVFFDGKYAYYIVCIYLSASLSLVKQKRRVSSTRQRFWHKLRACWPALKGSLALVHKPCIRPHCRACATGKKHPNYLLAFSDQGQRRCLYVPTAMVPVLKRALKNGRHIEQLLYEMGPALLEEYRLKHPAQTGPAVALARSAVPRKRTRKS